MVAELCEPVLLVLNLVAAGATKAFQELVNAFEHLSKPELYADEDLPEKKATAISRSNEGCVRTTMQCPR